MSNIFGDTRSGRQGQGYFPDDLGNALSDVVENLRAAFDQRIGPKLGRQDIRAAIMRLLSEKPMHGYQIIHEIETRSEGAWKPRPGSVYPTLQLLVDEGLVAAQETDGKKIYSLTDSGAESTDSGEPAPWDSQSDCDSARSARLPKAGAKLAQAAAQVAQSGTRQQTDDAVAAIDEARRKIYAILAQE